MSNAPQPEADQLVILKDDSMIGFHTRICSRETLTTAVFREVFNVAFAAEHHKEVADIVAGLLREARVDFEDGWIELRTGVADVVSFFEMQLAEAKAEADFEDKRRYEELQGRQKAEADYRTLREALRLALGPRAAVLQHVLEQAP
ncbi:hypothetical protein ACVWXO_008067 [Bradyrhizobium sp. LM2.7]